MLLCQIVLSLRANKVLHLLFESKVTLQYNTNLVLLDFTQSEIASIWFSVVRSMGNTSVTYLQRVQLSENMALDVCGNLKYFI